MIIMANSINSMEIVLVLIKNKEKEYCNDAISINSAEQRLRFDISVNEIENKSKKEQMNLTRLGWNP